MAYCFQRNHPKEHEKYKKDKQERKESTSKAGSSLKQKSIASFAQTMPARKSFDSAKYKKDDPRQIQLTDALLNLVAGNVITMNALDNPDFRAYCEALNPR